MFEDQGKKKNKLKPKEHRKQLLESSSEKEFLTLLEQKNFGRTCKWKNTWNTKFK